MIYAHCPTKCVKGKTIIYGYGIHPYNTPICGSALLDNQISY